MLVGRLVADSGKITTVAEARWLEVNGTDVIIAQGFDAGRQHESGIPQNSKQGLSGQAEFGLAFSLFRPE